MPAESKDWIYVENSQFRMWYSLEKRQSVLQFQTTAKTHHFDIRRDNNRFTFFKNKPVFYWNMNELEQRQWELSQTPTSLFSLLIPTAQAASCDLPSQSPSSLAGFMDQFQWKVISDGVKSCSSEILKQLFQSFIDGLSENIQFVGDFLSDPEAMLKKIVSSFIGLDETIKNGFAALVDIIGRLTKLTGAAAQQLLCQLVGDTTGQLAMAVVGGPKNIVSAGANIKRFFNRIRENYQPLVQAMERNPRIAATAVVLSHKLEDVRTRTSLTPSRFERESLEKHYTKHGSEFGARDPEEYEAMARSFASSRKGLTVVTQNASAKWDPKTNEFIVLQPSGRLVTYYKLEPKVTPQNPVDAFERLLRTGSPVSELPKLRNQLPR